MTQSVTKAALSAVLSAAVAIPALATEVAWNGDGNYDLGADDTLLFASDTTITASSKFTGSGKIIVSGGTLTLAYKMGEATPFDDFAGTVEILSGATVYSKGGGAFSEAGDPYDKSALGKSSVTIHFKGGTLKGFSKENNSQITGPVVVESGTESKIDNSEANSGHGVNLRVRNTSSFSGSGKLTVTSRDRWVEFAKGIDFTGLTGEIVLDGASTQNANFYGTDYGESAKWTFDASRDFKVSPGQGNTSKFGAIATNEKGNINLGDSNTTLEVGAKSGTDSIIDIPFTGKAFTLLKKGADTTLTLSSGVTFVSGSSLAVDAGTLLLDGCDISGVTATYAAGTTLKVTSNGGTAALGSTFGNLDVSDGKLTFAAAGNWENGGTYDLFTVSGTLTGDINTQIQITGMSGHAGFDFVNDNGTVKATVTEPTLAWANNANAGWNDAGAWLIGNTPCDYAPGDRVSFENGDVVLLDSEVSPKSFSIPAGATVTVIGSDAAKIAAESFSNNGILAISGDVVVDGQLAGNVNVAADSTLTFVDGQSLAGLTFTGTGKVKFNTSDTMDFTYQSLVDNGVFTGFSGTLELTGGVTLNNTSRFNNDSAVIFPSAMTILFNGGTITENVDSVNIRVHAKVVVESEANTFISRQANLSFAGPIEGSGKIRLETYQRGVRFYGDNSNFEGEADLYAGDMHCSLGFDSKQTGSAKATWNLKNDKYSTSQEWYRFTLSFGYNYDGFTTEEKALHLGAFNVEKPNAILRTYSNPTWLVIGEKNEACAIEGRFTDGLETTKCKAVHIVKKGTDVLTLGTNTMVVSGSTVRVDEGTLEVKCENELVATITVKSGAVLKGTGSVSSVAFEEGAKMDFAYPAPVKGSTVDGIVAASWSGVRPTLANPPAVNGGKWKLRTKDVEGGTQFYAEFMPSGLMVIFR